MQTQKQMKKKKEIQQALERTNAELLACNSKAVKGYVQSLAGTAKALRWILGYSWQENLEEHKRVTAKTLMKWYKIPA